MIDKKPKWQKEIESFKGIKSTFIIEGNINDIYPYYLDENSVNYLDLDFLLTQMLKIDEENKDNDKLEYDFVFCNPVLGFYNKRIHTNVANVLRDFDKSGNNIFKKEKPNYIVDDIEKFAIWLLTEFRYKNQTLSFAPGPGFYTTPGKGIKEARFSFCTHNLIEIENGMKVLKHALEEYNKNNK